MKISAIVQNCGAILASPSNLKNNFGNIFKKIFEIFLIFKIFFKILIFKFFFENFDFLKIFKKFFENVPKIIF